MDTGRSSKNEATEKGYLQRKKYFRWTLISTLITFFLSYTINLISEVSIEGAPNIVAICVLLFIIFIGVIFDMVGTAVTAADEAPFHSMATHRVKGANIGIMLVRNAERVSNICNDVIGDICGIVSGSTTAVLVSHILIFEKGNLLFGIAITAAVASLTVGGKAFGKGIALSRANDVVYAVAKALSVFEKDAKNGKRDKKNSK